MAANDFHRLLEQFGTLTGSRAWGLETEGSDYDYFLRHRDYLYLLEGLEEDKIQCYMGSSVFNSIKFEIDGKEFNVWAVPPDKWKDWLACDLVMHSLCMMSPVAKETLTQKHARVSLYEQLRELTGAGDSNFYDRTSFERTLSQKEGHPFEDH